MALTTIVTTALANSTGGTVPLTGAQQVNVTGNFGNLQVATVGLDVSLNGGTTWAPIPGTRTMFPTAYVVELGIDASLRAVVVGGDGTTSITIIASGLP